MSSTRRDGFTLLEVLVAFVIAALAFSVMFKAVGAGVGAVDTAGRYQEAVSRAKSHLAEIGRDGVLAESRTSGDDGAGYRWQIAIQRVAATKPLSANDQNGDAPNPPWPLGLFRVTVGITWTASGRSHEVELQSQRTALLEHVANDQSR